MPTIDALRHLVQEEVANGTALAALLLWVSVVGSALVTYRAQQRSLGQHLLPPGTTKNPSARADVLFFVTRRITFLFITVPAIFTAAWVGSHLHDLLARYLPGLSLPSHTTPLSLYIFTLIMFLGYDISYYWYHSLQHRVGWMWELHKVHHSAEVLVGVTKDRVHPLDHLMNHAWDAMITGPLFALSLFFISNPIEVAILGVNVYTLRNILMMDFVRHTHYKMSFGRWLNGLVICPHYHQLHHSTNPKHWDKNFGLMLAVWDRMFGTFYVPEPNEDFDFGLPDGEHHEYQSVTRLYLLPLAKIFALMFPLGRRAKI